MVKGDAFANRVYRCSFCRQLPDRPDPAARRRQAAAPARKAAATADGGAVRRRTEPERPAAAVGESAAGCAGRGAAGADCLRQGAAEKLCRAHRGAVFGLVLLLRGDALCLHRPASQGARRLQRRRLC